MKNTDTEKPDLSKATILADGNRGIYSYQHIAKTYGHLIENNSLSKEDRTSLENGPDDEWYLDAAANLIDNAFLTLDGKRCYLHQQDDIWAVPMQ